MKTLNTISSILLFVLTTSCKDSREELAIKNYVQDFGKTKLELNIKILEKNEIGLITSKDSIRIIDSIIQSLALRKKYEIEREISRIQAENKESLSELERRKRYESPVIFKIYKDANEKIGKLNDSYIRILNEDIDKINSGLYYDLSKEIKDNYKVRDSYQTNPGMILGIIIKCKYSFRNPLLNGITQENSEVFILDTLRSKVLHKY